MFVNLTAFTKAMNKVKAQANGNKQETVLIKCLDDKLRVCYCDGRQAVVENIECYFNENEEHRDFVINFSTLMGLLEVCQPIGSVLVDNIEMSVDDGYMLSIRVAKYVNIENEDFPDGIEKRTVSKFKQTVKVTAPDPKVHIVARMNFENVFAEHDNDVWDKAKLVSILTRLAKEEDKVILISSKSKSAFVANLAYTGLIKTEEVDNASMCLSGKMAKIIVDILNKSDATEVEVLTDDSKYCTIRDTDEKLAIWFEMAKVNRMSIGSMEMYTSRTYDTFQLVFLREALMNVIKCSLAVANGSEALELKFRNEGEGTEMLFGGLGKASKENDFAVRAEVSTNDEALIEQVLKVNVSVLNDIIGLCNEGYIGMEILVDENEQRFVRFVDICDTDENGKLIADAMYFTTMSK